MHFGPTYQRSFMVYQQKSRLLEEPAIISSDNSPATKFQERFDYIGTRDYTSWCAMGAALDFRKMVGAVDVIVFCLGGGGVYMNYL